MTTMNDYHKQAKEIGSRIRAKREELGMTQEQLANKLGYKSKSSITKIESGERDLRQKKIKTIADALGTTPDYLMGWSINSSSTHSRLEHSLGVISLSLDDKQLEELIEYAKSLKEKNK